MTNTVTMDGILAKIKKTTYTLLPDGRPYVDWPTVKLFLEKYDE